jgi:succinate dehydrogenase/fumarate reductase flavoprotein subunit
MTRAALARAESRGTHQRTDVPSVDAAMAVHLDWSIGRDAPLRRALDAGVPA